MTRNKITHAMILAAGYGTRMRPLTQEKPKALIELNGQCLLDHSLDRLAAFGIKHVIINTHHLGAAIADHLRHRHSPTCHTVHEDTLLDSGGGIKNALPHLGEDAFFVINGDVFWQDSVHTCFDHLARMWTPQDMDALLLLHPTVRAIGYEGEGDFHLDQGGIVHPREDARIAPYVFTGIQIVHPALFKNSPPGPFSIRRLFERAMGEKRLHGHVHLGEWYHIGTPQSLAEAEASLAEGAPSHVASP